jgi:CRISPR/Cas system-associated exonuclease Cas4 (RecB family)
VVKIKKRTLSPTAINTYLACPKKFYLRYIKKLKTRPSIHLIRGQIVHKTIHEFHKNHPSIQPRDAPGQIRHELLKLFNNYWQTAGDSLNNLGISKEQLDFYHDDSEVMLLNFSHWFCKNDMPLPDLTEARILSDNLKLLGIIDAVFEKVDKVILVDYKTSKHDKITDDIVRQATLYSLLYQDRFKKVPDEVGIHFLKEPGDPKPIHINDSLLEYGKNLIRFIREKTLSEAENNYPCTCGGYCERDFIKN